MANVNKNYTFLTGTITSKNEIGQVAKYNIWIKQPFNYRLEYSPDINKPEEIIVAVNSGKKVQIKEVNGNIKESNPIPEMSKSIETLPDNMVVPN